jgi:NAD(P)-dependent dehydrogenase (short-subunit alcohol dehydrogenase family)
MAELDGKVAVVTGAGRGLGRAFAVGLAEAGAKVVLVGRRLGPESNPESLLHTSKLIEDAGGEALCCQGAVSDMEAMQQMAYRASDRFGGVDILVNNAGMHHMATFSETTFEQWHEVIDGFLTGAFICSKVITPLLIQRGGGHIINIGSRAATSDDAGAFAYGVIRGGMVRFTTKMASDLRRHNIAVNSYGPGLMLTERVVEVLGEGNPRLGQAHDPAKSAPHVVWIAQQGPDFTGNVVYLDEWQKTWGPGVAATPS